MKIEVWSDVVCPFCYIGKRKLEAALENFPHRADVAVEFKSYQLDPNTQAYNGQSYYESLAQKFGSVEQVKQMTAGVAEQAKQVGLTFNFEDMKSTNTFDAHRITKYAKQHGKDGIISEKLLYAHFTDSKDVGNLDVLADIATASGLDREESLGILKDKDKHADEVRADIEEAKRYGISGVPYFIINQKYAISGAQATETFTQALEKVWEEENPRPKLQDLSANASNDDGSICADGSCAVPQTE